MATHPARRFWYSVEPLNAVSYFSPECREGNASLGFKGFWMGYAANRGAPLGVASVGTIESTFFNFAPARVNRAFPDAWAYASPEAVVEARSQHAAAALRRLVPDIDDVAAQVEPVLRRAVEQAPRAGRPLFEANRDIHPDDPVEALWQASTALREHRGDGHIALLTAEGLDGCEALVVHAATADLPPDLLRNSRGWTEDEWGDAVQRLVDRDVMGPDGITAAGRRARELVEERTDELTMAALRPIADEVDRVCDLLRPVARQISAAGEMPFPNPMGFPDTE